MERRKHLTFYIRYRRSSVWLRPNHNLFYFFLKDRFFFVDVLSLIRWSIAAFLWAVTATCRRVERCETTVHHWHASATSEKTAPYRAHPKGSLQRITIKTRVSVSPIHLTKEDQSWLHAELLVEAKL